MKDEKLSNLDYSIISKQQVTSSATAVTFSITRGQNLSVSIPNHKTYEQETKNIKELKPRNRFLVTRKSKHKFTKKMVHIHDQHKTTNKKNYLPQQPSVESSNSKKQMKRKWQVNK